MYQLPTELLSVSDLTYRIKEILEYEYELQEVYLQGEVSNFTLHGSGHAYFTLKDEDAQISCVMFRGSIDGRVKSILKHGAKLIVQGSVTVYAQRGNYQLLVTDVKSYGLGDLYQQFLKLKEKLQQEGLFDELHKKPLPAFPINIGIITSPTGAVIQDIIRTIQRRYPCVNLVLSPAIVQGEQAADSILSALHQLTAKPEIELIIVARGGGSIEDLWCFNSELLARAIFACQIPVISAIGHETDFTILDFVADVRAATPTAAAQLAVPDAGELMAHLTQMQVNMRTSIQYNLYNKMQWLDDVAEKTAMQRNYLLQQKKSELQILEASLQQFNPRAFLEKGFSLVLKNNQIVKSVREVAVGDELEIIMKDGRVGVTVK